jgi:hypothetical protein
MATENGRWCVLRTDADPSVFMMSAGIGRHHRECFFGYSRETVAAEINQFFRTARTIMHGAGPLRPFVPGQVRLSAQFSSRELRLFDRINRRRPI